MTVGLKLCASQDPQEESKVESWDSVDGSRHFGISRNSLGWSRS